MDNYISRPEHEEFVKRMEEEHTRQNHRIADLEKISEQNNKLLISINNLATSMENMQKEQKKQGDRLQVLESRDGEMWRKVTGYIITTVLGIVVGYLLKQIGLM